MLRIALAYQRGVIAPERVDLALGRGIGVEIGGDHEPVVVVEPADQVAIAVRIVGREHARGDRFERLRELAAMPR